MTEVRWLETNTTREMVEYTDEQILTHLRGGGEHYRGCWVIDLLLGKS